MREEKIRLFLDDDRNPKDCKNYAYNFGIDCSIYNEEWHIVRTYKQFVDFINKKGIPDIISFDHDISDFDSFGKEWTGKDCANWLINYCLDNDIKIIPEYYVHSGNTPGRESINSLLKNFNKFISNL